GPDTVSADYLHHELCARARNARGRSRSNGSDDDGHDSNYRWDSPRRRLCTRSLYGASRPKRSLASPRGNDVGNRRLSDGARVRPLDGAQVFLDVRREPAPLVEVPTGPSAREG